MSSSLRGTIEKARLAWVVGALVLLLALPLAVPAQDKSIEQKLKGFDAYMQQTLKEWNAPGVAVGIVVGDKLVFAKGYGYRDYEKKLPMTPATLCPIASNTKLFTSVAMGLLVNEGKLDWDKPVREAVPTIKFYDDKLNSTVSLRDMLSHRTGITRHDLIWYKSPFTRKELFERLRFMEPKEPIRTTFLYNNMMFAAAGQIIEIKTGKTWEEFVAGRIFGPLGMKSSVYAIADMTKAPDFGVPFTEKRDTTEIYKIPYYEDTVGVAPAGAIISNVEDMSHWLIALMNDGRFEGKNIVPPEVLKATLEPAIALPNAMGEARGYWELLNGAYCMGRETASYRGHLITFHGGDIDGFHSQISFMPLDHVGVVVFVIGDHCAMLRDVVGYNVYERLAGLSQTPWSARLNEIRLKGKKAGTEARSKAGAEKVPGTHPSHPLEAYVADFENPGYGVIRIGLKDGQLQFGFHEFQFPLTHFHYDRFDTPDDERYGRFSVNFGTSPQGDVDKITISLDESEAVFTRKAEALSQDTLGKLAGTYETPSGAHFQVVLKEDGVLYLLFPGEPPQKLIAYKGLTFRIPEFSDVTIEFVMEKGQVTGLKQRDPGGEYFFKRK